MKEPPLCKDDPSNGPVRPWYAPFAVSFTIDPARLFRWQCSLVAAVILTHVVLGLLGVLAGHDRVLGVARLFDVRHEGNVPTFLSAVVLLAGAITAGSMPRAGRAGAQHAGTWTWVAAALLFAALDEAAQIHELLSGPLRRALGATGPLYFAWILPYGAAIVLGSLLAFPALMALGTAATRWVSLGMVSAFAGAIGIEMLQGVLWTRNGPAAFRKKKREHVALSGERQCRLLEAVFRGLAEQ